MTGCGGGKPGMIPPTSPSHRRPGTPTSRAQPDQAPAAHWGPMGSRGLIARRCRRTDLAASHCNYSSHPGAGQGAWSASPGSWTAGLEAVEVAHPGGVVGQAGIDGGEVAGDDGEFGSSRYRDLADLLLISQQGDRARRRRKPLHREADRRRRTGTRVALPASFEVSGPDWQEGDSSKPPWLWVCRVVPVTPKRPRRPPPSSIPCLPRRPLAPGIRGPRHGRSHDRWPLRQNWGLAA